MAKKMSNAPIYYALVQVKFNVLLSLDQYVATIQDRLRKIGLVDYEQVVQTTINLVGGNGDQVIPQRNLQHAFYDEQKKIKLTLEKMALTLSTSDYETFEQFLATFMDSLQIVHECVGKLSFSERIGIRFFDAVSPNENEDLHKYLIPSLFGLVDRIDGRRLVQSISETRTEDRGTTLLSRVAILEQDRGPVAFPEEFGSVNINLNEKFMSISGRYAILDTDCWYDGRESFNLDNIRSRIAQLHDQLGQSFKQMVTPYALDVWK